MTQLPEPVDHECLPCYLYRVALIQPCDGGLEVLCRYRDERAPRATALVRKMMLLGGYCDCEVLLNSFRPATAKTAHAVERGQDLVCHGVRRGTTQPCDQWVRRRGVQWGGGQFRPRSA